MKHPNLHKSLEELDKEICQLEVGKITDTQTLVNAIKLTSEKHESLSKRINSLYSPTKTEERTIVKRKRSINGLDTVMYMSMEESQLMRKCYSLFKRLGKLRSKFGVSRPVPETMTISRALSNIPLGVLNDIKEHYNAKSHKDFINLGNLLKSTATSNQRYKTFFTLASRLVMEDRLRISFGNLITEYAVACCKTNYNIDIGLTSKEIKSFKTSIVKRLFNEEI